MAFPSWTQDFDPRSRTTLPSVPDRLLAFLIDCLIMFPVIGLAVAADVKQLKIMTLMNSTSEFVSRAGFLVLFEVMVLAVVLEALFVRFHGGTPGQRFLQMKVVSSVDGGRIDFLQAVQRAALWWVGMVTVLPLFSIYTNDKRRAFHDRATDTLLISERSEGDAGPHPGERALFRSWTRVAFVIFLMLSVTAFFETRNRLHRPELLHEMASRKDLDCPTLVGETNPLRRLDLGVVLFRLGSLKEECLAELGERAAWSADAELQAAGFLAKSYLPSGHASALYRERVCAVAPASEACAVVGFLASDKEDRGDLLRRKGLSSLLARALLLEDSIDRRQFLSAAALLEDLGREESLEKGALDRLAMKTLWGMSQGDGARAPAATGAAAEWDRVIASLRKRLDLQ